MPAKHLFKNHTLYISYVYNVKDLYSVHILNDSEFSELRKHSDKWITQLAYVCHCQSSVHSVKIEHSGQWKKKKTSWTSLMWKLRNKRGCPPNVLRMCGIWPFIGIFLFLWITLCLSVSVFVPYFIWIIPFYSLAFNSFICILCLCFTLSSWLLLVLHSPSVHTLLPILSC